MKKHLAVIVLAALAVTSVTISCKHKPNALPTYGGYPDEIGKIFVDRCATSGCHNEASYTAAGGLRLDSWENLFKGGNNGAAVVAYSTEYSPLLYFINRAEHGNADIVSTPTMPESGTPLTKDEYEMVKSWIAKGAPDKNGNIPFGENRDTRQKIYLTQQACDLVAVIDANSRLIMRYIKIGKEGTTESPHCIRIDNSGKFGYVSFTNGKWIQKINTSTDQVDNSMLLPEFKDQATNTTAQWNILYVSPNGGEVLLSDWRANSRCVLVKSDFTGMPVAYPDRLQNPHGIASNAAFDTFFVTAQYGNIIYKFAKNDFGTPAIVNLDSGSRPPTTTSIPGVTPNPHEIVMLPGYDRYIVTCESTNDVRIVDAHTNKVIAIIPVGKFPQEIALSPKNHLAYISCMNDAPNGYFKGSVWVIDYNTYQPVGSPITGQMAQPHGLAVDDRSNSLFIASINTDGPAPHHASSCAGKNGYYQVYSSIPPFNQLDNKTYEVSVQPYSADVRFK